MNKGLIAINKPKGWTSFDVVNKIKHLLKTSKVGHLGTLDPMATGVLLVTVGKATKLFDFMQQKRKTYLAKFEFGYVTDTLDATGKITENVDFIPTKQQILDILPSFIGEIEQIPPKVSAKKVNGKRAYDLAKQDKDFELKPCKVNIYDLKLISFENKILELEICCGSGTYIRSLCRDIAQKLNSLATMISLIRTQIDGFDLNLCEDMENFDAENIESKIIKIDKVLNLPILNLSTNEQQKILNGMTLITEEKDGVYKLNDENDTIALVKIEKKRAKMMIFLQ